MAERYVESFIMRQDNNPDVLEPTLTDDDCDSEFELKATVKLMQIEKSVQNAVHNRHVYVFKVIEIKKMKKEK